MNVPILPVSPNEATALHWFEVIPLVQHGRISKGSDNADTNARAKSPRTCAPDTSWESVRSCRRAGQKRCCGVLPARLDPRLNQPDSLVSGATRQVRGAQHPGPGCKRRPHTSPYSLGRAPGWHHLSSRIRFLAAWRGFPEVGSLQGARRTLRTRYLHCRPGWLHQVCGRSRHR